VEILSQPRTRAIQDCRSYVGLDRLLLDKPANVYAIAGLLVIGDGTDHGRLNPVHAWGIRIKLCQHSALHRFTPTRVGNGVALHGPGNPVPNQPVRADGPEQACIPPASNLRWMSFWRVR
jgi:hypothetical protein